MNVDYVSRAVRDAVADVEHGDIAAAVLTLAVMIGEQTRELRELRAEVSALVYTASLPPARSTT